jgi:hypothetical protein
MSVDRARLWMRKADNDLLAADNNLASRRIPCELTTFWLSWRMCGGLPRSLYPMRSVLRASS